MIRTLLFFCSCIIAGTWLLNSCASPEADDGIRKDSTSIKAGRNAFTEKCAGCHNFLEDGIGPHLAGVTTDRPVSWIKQFIRDPRKMIESRDSVADKLYREFRTMMPSFAEMSDGELDALIAYMHTYKKTELHLAAEDTNYLSNPITDTIEKSDVTVDIKPLLQVPASSPQAPKTRIVKMDYMPGTATAGGAGELFIVDLRGILYRIVNGRAELYMDMKKLRPKFINQPGLATGFGSFAFHPEFLKNGLLYTTHTEPARTSKADFRYHDSIPVELQWVLTEWKTSSKPHEPFAGKGRELLRINMPSGIHGVQEITFNKFARPGHHDYGLLYVGIGDGGSAELRHFIITSQPHSIWGSIIRIDPAGKNSSSGQYGIPATNPFAKDKKAVREIIAWGFRNPHKINWSRDGRMFAVNIGELNIESLNLIEPGKYYGWPVREGTFLIEFMKNKRQVHPLPADDSVNRITYPVAQFDHDEGTAISGGFEYQGEAVQRLKGKYVFGDIGSGKLFYVEMKDLQQGRQAPIKSWNISLNGKTTTLLELCKASRADMRFGMDAAGELYIFTKQDGMVYRLGPSS